MTWTHDTFDDPTWPIVVDGENSRREGDLKSALSAFSTAIAAFTDSTSDRVQVETYICRGVAHAQNGDEDHAISDYSAAIDLDPKRALAYFNRGCAYERVSQEDRAIEDFDRVIELRPDNPDAYIIRGGLLKRRGQLDEAQADFAMVRTINNDTNT
jgi:tetratricopeptide (TPR) repeat protein